MQATFSSALASQGSPDVPAAISSRISREKHQNSLGKVRVLLRLSGPISTQSHLAVDYKNSQVQLRNEDASTPRSPKIFKFDSIFSESTSQTEVAGAALTETLSSVINGSDGCVISVAQRHTDGEWSMIGDGRCTAKFGIIPLAVSWLYRTLAVQAGVHSCAVQISAVAFGNEKLLDVLLPERHDNASAHDRMCDDQCSCDASFLSQLSDASVATVNAVDMALRFLETAVQESRRQCPCRRHTPHLLVTVTLQHHVRSSQRVAESHKGRLHLYHLGTSAGHGEEDGHSLTSITNAVASVFSNQKCPSHRSSVLSQLLRASMSSMLCHTTVLAHIDPISSCYADTLTVARLATRIHRMRRPRTKIQSSGSDGSGGNGHRGQKMLSRDNPDAFFSEPDPSSSEMSADTVIYRGPQHEDFTDGEHPPTLVGAVHIRKERHSHQQFKHEKTNQMCNSAQSTPSKRHRQNRTSHHLSINCQNQNHRSGRTHHKSQPNKNDSLSSSKARHRTQQQEQWIDGPSQTPAQTGHLDAVTRLKETWIDGPRSLCGALPVASEDIPASGYGYMNESKAHMISRWVEHQSSLQRSLSPPPPGVLESPQKDTNITGDRSSQHPIMLTKFKQVDDDDNKNNDRCRRCRDSTASADDSSNKLMQCPANCANDTAVTLVDSGVQVSEQDIIWTSRQNALLSKNLRSTEANDDCFSERPASRQRGDNVWCSSASLNHIDYQSMQHDLTDSHQLDYDKVCKDLSLTNLRLDSIKRLQEFYRELATGSMAKIPQLPSYTSNMDTTRETPLPTPDRVHWEASSVTSEPPPLANTTSSMIRGATTDVNNSATFRSVDARRGNTDNVTSTDPAYFGQAASNRLSHDIVSSALSNNIEDTLFDTINNCSQEKQTLIDRKMYRNTCTHVRSSILDNVDPTAEIQSHLWVAAVQDQSNHCTFSDRVWRQEEAPVCEYTAREHFPESQIIGLQINGNQETSSSSQDNESNASKLPRARKIFRMSRRQKLTTTANTDHLATSAVDNDVWKQVLQNCRQVKNQPSDYDSGTDSGISMVKTPPRQNSLPNQVNQHDESKNCLQLSHQQIQTGSPFRKPGLTHKCNNQDDKHHPTATTQPLTMIHRKTKTSKGVAIIRRLWRKH